MVKTKGYARLVVAMLMAVACASAASAGSAPAEPPDSVEFGEQEFYGGARNVELLAELLADKDAAVRERAVADLGQTRNPLALPHLRKALTDEAPRVRLTAIGAAVCFPDQAVELVRAAFKSPPADDRMRLAALRVVRCLSLKAAADEVKAAVGDSDANVQAAALQTLTAMEIPVDRKQLVGLLSSFSWPVQMRAAQNALLLGKDEAVDVISELMRLARSGAVPVRCEAMRALGKFNWPAAQEVLQSAAKDANPLLRQGALRGLEAAGQARAIRPFLDDPSEMVRQAAIRAAGNLGCTDCAGRLFERMLAAPRHDPPVPDYHAYVRDSIDDHLAACKSLVAIKDNSVPAMAAQALPKFLQECRQATGEYQTPPQALASRNARACMHLLGAYRSSLAIQTQLELLESLPTDSPILAEVAWSLGQLRDPRAVRPLQALLGKCVPLARKRLETRMATPPVYVPFREEVAAKTISALAALDAKDSVPQVLELATMNVQGARLHLTAIAAVHALGRMQTPQNAQAVDQAMAEIISDEAGMAPVRLAAIKEAARQGRQAALPAIRAVLQKERPGRWLMSAAVWAVYKLTGQAPEMPEPRVVQGQWIVQTR